MEGGVARAFGSGEATHATGSNGQFTSISYAASRSGSEAGLRGARRVVPV